MAEPTEIHDTSAVSNFLKFGDRSSAYPWFQKPHVPAISFQTAAELLVWALSKSIAPMARSKSAPSWPTPSSSTACPTP